MLIEEPDSIRTDLHSSNRTQHQYSAVQNSQSPFHFDCKIDVSWIKCIERQSEMKIVEEILLPGVSMILMA